MDIQVDRVEPATKAKYQKKSKLLLLKEDVRKVSIHPNSDEMCLLETSDGANFSVCETFVKLKGVLVSA